MQQLQSQTDMCFIVFLVAKILYVFRTQIQKSFVFDCVFCVCLCSFKNTNYGTLTVIIFDLPSLKNANFSSLGRELSYGNHVGIPIGFWVKTNKTKNFDMPGESPVETPF